MPLRPARGSLSLELPGALWVQAPHDCSQLFQNRALLVLALTLVPLSPQLPLPGDGVIFRVGADRLQLEGELLQSVVGHTGGS